MLTRCLLLLTLFFSYSCNNNGKKEILDQFSKIDEAVEETSLVVRKSTTTLYDSALLKYPASYLNRLRDSVSVMVKYIMGLKKAFAVYCGDSSGVSIPDEFQDSITLSNQFFLEQGHAQLFWNRFKSMEPLFLPYAKSLELQNEIRRMASIPAHSRRTAVELFFYHVPPVAANTILSKFANDLATVEHKILLELLKN